MGYSSSVKFCGAVNAASIVFVVQIELQIKQRCHPTCWGAERLLAASNRGLTKGVELVTLASITLSEDRVLKTYHR